MKKTVRSDTASLLKHYGVFLLGIFFLTANLSAFAALPVIFDAPASQTIFIGDPVSFSVSASGTAPFTYQWRRNGTSIAGETNRSLNFITAGDDDGDLFSVLVSNSSGSVISEAAELTIDFGMGGAAQTNRLIEFTTPWRYDVNGNNLGTAWRAPGYADGSWSSGGGLLYVEDDTVPAPKTTALPLIAKSLPTTCYFRTSFTNNITDVYSMNLVANTVVDDGLVLYLNGTEVLRNHMDAGTVSYNTLANNVGNASVEGPYLLDTAGLLNGANLLAAEVHQSSATSSDIVMGLSLDMIWQERLRDTAAPTVATLNPASGSSVTVLTQIQVVFNEGVSGVNASDLLINGTPASSVTVNSDADYLFHFTEPAEGVVNVSWAANHGINDLSAGSHAFVGAGFSYLFAPPSTDVQLAFSSVFQSSDSSASTKAVNAVDGNAMSYSRTDNLPSSYWKAELGRPFELDRIELVNQPAPNDAEMEGLTLSLLNMDDQVVYETILTNPGASGISVINLPAGISARTLRIGLSGSDVNGAGNYRVGLTEVRIIGEAQIPFSPEPVPGGESDVEITGFSVSQTTEWNDGEFPAENAVDGNTGNFSHTDSSTPNNYWIADLGTAGPIARVELVNRDSSAERMDNLVIRILDAGMNSVASDVTSNPGASATYTFNTPANTVGRYVRVGLENGEENGRDYAIQLAEVRIYSEASGSALPPQPTANLATGKRSYMLRLTDSLPPASNANDGDMSTETYTTSQTVDGYWEVDLGETFALYGVRAVSAAAVGDRLASTICRLFDENHDSVLERPLTGNAPVFDVDVDGPVFARYVRVGLEDKTRTDGNPGGFIGFREVEVFGRPASEVGIQSFSVSDTAVAGGQSVTLDWSVEDVKRAEIFPDIGSVGSYTDTNGVGSFVQTMTASTEFIMVATNNAWIFTHAVGVEVNGATLPIVISEVLADNQYSLEDGYGDASDWIELRNTGNTTVDLTGWGLSDNPAKPMKFTFPSTTMAPHETLIVFASNRDVAVDPEGMLHADFALGKNGETVQLTAANGSTVIDSVSYPELDTDLAYGRDLEGRWTLMEPTPGAVNTGTAYEGWLNSLDWSHARGIYETNFTLTVTSADPDATILYSLDGTEPSIPYTGGLSISGTSVVRVQAVWPGYKPARIETKSFIFLDDVIADLDTDITQDPTYGPRVKPGLLALPTISLVVSSTGNAIDAIEYDEQACSFELLWPDGQNPIQEDCGISRFGGAYSYFEKKAFSLAFRQKYGNGKLKAPLFNGFDRGVLAKTSFDRLHLRGGNHDWSRSFGMSDRFIQDSYLDMGSLNPHGRFVHVYLNGEYWGQYNCKEVLNESFLADYLGGDEDDYVSVKGNDNGGGGPGGWVIGAGDPPNPEPWERVRALRDDFEAVSPYLDVSHYIDYMLLYGFGGSENEFRGCGPKTAGSGYKFWINDPDGFVNDGRVDDDKSIGAWGPGGIWAGLHGENHPDFKMLLADRIYKNFFNDGAMTHAQCNARLQARMDETRDSFLAECARWGRSYTSWEDDANTAYTSYFNHQANDMVAAWRNAGYFPSFDPPTFNQYGGAVLEGFQPILTSSAGTIYYTLDGTDPRLPGGSISPAALIWSAGAVTVTEDITITSRVRTSGGEWSALAEPRFLLGSRQVPTAGELLITEISYNPDGSDDYEFIEIWNSSTNLIDMSGVSLSNAVRYIFPEYATLNPGAFVVVVVEDAASFSNRYQNVSSPWYWDGIEVAGEWVGALSDGGETIVLTDAAGATLSTVSYTVGGDWPEAPDGGGSSLEVRSPDQVPSEINAQTIYLADGKNWTASALYHGSPGRFAVYEPSVVINEVLSHTDMGVDWIELYNASASVVDLAGYALTDDLDQPARYVFPSGSLIPAHGYLTVSASELDFGFSELGSSASLLQVEGGDVLRFMDHVEFPAAAREESFGRYLRSDGVELFTEQLASTKGYANGLPRVGPVVLSEIMYVPMLGKSAYLEFYNISDADVPLYDLSIASNTWNVSGIGDYAFPEGVVLPPLTPLILCATNPAVFRAQYGLDSSVPVYGPWTGNLDPDGEMLELLNPGDPEPDGFVPYYRADYVAYRTNANWAVAHTGNVSLERYPLNSFGNDPASWRASAVGGTPGTVEEYRDSFNSDISISAGQLPIIGFPAIPGQTYEVHFTESLLNPQWYILSSVPEASSNWVNVIDPELPVSNRFYRIYWEAP
ncbi:lamin tail domain-containing protein [Pontiellaceae bacterium B12219]|nr:lamin tail domain-containing protein [Pontiellaceae bacterium B12219]